MNEFLCIPCSMEQGWVFLSLDGSTLVCKRCGRCAEVQFQDSTFFALDDFSVSGGHTVHERSIRSLPEWAADCNGLPEELVVALQRQDTLWLEERQQRRKAALTKLFLDFPAVEKGFFEELMLCIEYEVSYGGDWMSLAREWFEERLEGLVVDQALDLLLEYL